MTQHDEQGEVGDWTLTQADILSLPETGDTEVTKIKKLLLRVAATQKQMAILGKGLAQVSEAHDKNISLLKRANDIQIQILEELVARVDRLEQKMGL